MRYVMIMAGAMAVLAGCQEDGPLEGESALGGPPVAVYEPGPQVKQCAEPAITVAQSAQKLANVGVPVASSSCGAMKGVAFPAMCGAATAFIILHDIPSEGLRRAEGAGFKPASTLVDEARGLGWERTTCLN